jgi:monoamine oxidase
MPAGLTRRAFLKGVIAKGAIAAAGIGSAAAVKPRRSERVVIVGAGVAGLAAASELRANGIDDIVILEARDRIGGRIWTDTIGGHIPIDLGASWIHGVDGNPVSAIAAKNDIATHPTDYDNEVVYFQGAGRSRLSDGEALRRFWELAEKQPDGTLQSTYEKYLSTYNPGDAERRHLEYLLNTIVEHEYGADMEDLSLLSVEGGSAYDGHDAVFPGGYRQIIDALADGAATRLEQAVTEIDYSGTVIVLTTAAGASFEADRIIVTVPLGLLKKNRISFLPRLPLRKERAIARLEMGVLNKTCLLFDEVFWDRDAEFIGHVGAEKGHWAETLNLYPYTGQPMLMMFNAGTYGAQLERYSDRRIVESAVAVLTDMYGRVPPPGDARITRWNSDPWTHGSYSYVPAGSSFEQYAVLGEPVDDRIFFAGEATHHEYPATVHGALLSGVRAAREIAALATLF